MQHATPFAMAGLWDTWGDLYSCTIITTVANELMAPIHDRMPVILAQDDYAQWLSPDNTDTDGLQALLRPSSPEDMECWQVSKQVNSPKNDDVSLIKKASAF